MLFRSFSSGGETPGPKTFHEVNRMITRMRAVIVRMVFFIVFKKADKNYWIQNGASQGTMIRIIDADNTITYIVEVASSLCFSQNKQKTPSLQTGFGNIFCKIILAVVVDWWMQECPEPALYLMHLYLLVQ